MIYNLGIDSLLRPGWSLWNFWCFIHLFFPSSVLWSSTILGLHIQYTYVHTEKNVFQNMQKLWKTSMQEGGSPHGQIKKLEYMLRVNVNI